MLYILNIHSDSNILFGGCYFFKSKNVVGEILNCGHSSGIVCYAEQGRLYTF